MNKEKRNPRISLPKKLKPHIRHISAIILISVTALMLHLHVKEVKKNNQIAHHKFETNIICETINSKLNMASQIARSLTKNKHIIHALRYRRNPFAATLRTTLSTARDAAHASHVYIMTPNGIIFSISTGGDYLIGKSYKFRPYFEQAIRGIATIYPALGTTTRQRGIFHSMPIYQKNSTTPIGVVVIKVDIDEIEDFLKTKKNPLLLTSPDGIIFSANNNNWHFKSIRSLDKSILENIKKSKQFSNKKILSGPFFFLQNKSITLSNKKFHAYQAPLIIKNWHITSLSLLNKKDPLSIAQWQKIIGIVIIFYLLIFFIWILQRNIHKRKETEKELEQHKNELEILVSKRTARLEQEISDRHKTELALIKSQNLYKIIFETTGTANAIVEESTIISLVNAGFEKLSGYSKEEIENNITWSTFVAEEDIERTLTYHWNRRHNKPAPNVYEFKFINRKQETRNAIAFVAIIPNTTSSVLSILDITDRKYAEQQLIESQKMLKSSNSAKDKFFSIIAHDLRNPLSAIMSFSALLATDIKALPPEKIAPLSEELHHTVKNTAALLENLLTWASSQTGDIQFNPQYFYLAPSTKKTIELLAASAKKKKIKITSSIDNHLQTYADINLIETVLRNLISNGIKFTHEKGKITISAKKEKKEIHVTVTDTGIGMSEKDILNLFRIDAKITRTGTDNEKGTGLGLYLCKDFVEKNGGSIWVESQIGAGSTFHFTLPAAD